MNGWGVAHQKKPKFSCLAVTTAPMSPEELKAIYRPADNGHASVLLTWQPSMPVSPDYQYTIVYRLLSTSTTKEHTFNLSSVSLLQC